MRVRACVNACVSPQVSLLFFNRIFLFFCKLLSDFVIFAFLCQFRLLMHKFTHHFFFSVWDSCSGGKLFIFWFLFLSLSPVIAFVFFLFFVAFFAPHLLLTRCAHGAIGPWGALSTVYCNRLVICNIDGTIGAKTASYHVPVSDTGRCESRSVQRFSCTLTGLRRLQRRLLSRHAERTFSTWRGKKLIKAESNLQ